MTDPAPSDSPHRFAASVLIPCHNEASYIDACLEAVLAQTAVPGPLEVLVLANNCSDQTAARARAHLPRFAHLGWALNVMETPVAGKPHALNLGDDAANASIRVYLDADVICEPDLIGQLCTALQTTAPTYASGTFTLMPAVSWVSRRYGAFWQALPFMRSPAVGAGLFAVNGAGRARWAVFPDIISDDTFVRLHFAPHERVEVPARYHWPLVEGFANLVRVRRRQDAGVREIRALYPELMDNEGKGQTRLAPLFWSQPLNFSVYALVSLAVRLGGDNKAWSRGR